MRISDWSSDVCSSDLFGKRRIQGEIKAQYNPYGDRIVGGSGGIGWRGTLSYVDQFANDTIGIAIGVQRNDTNNPEETYAASSTWVACRRSEEHTSELQSLMRSSYAVCCLNKNIKTLNNYQ